MKLWQSFTNYVRGVSIFRKNFIEMLQLFTYDVGFVLSTLLFAQATNTVMPKSDAVLQALLVNMWGVLAFLLIYTLAIIAIYSLFKMLAINTLRAMFRREKIAWKHYPSFLLLNILILASMAVLWIVLSWIENGLQQNVQIYGALIFLPLFMYCSYVLTQESQAAFAQNKQIFASFQKGANELVRIKKRNPLFWSVLLGLLYLGVTLLLGTVLGLFMDTPYSYISIANISQPIFFLITLVVFYSIFSICRYNVFSRAWKD